MDNNLREQVYRRMVKTVMWYGLREDVRSATMMHVWHEVKNYNLEKVWFPVGSIVYQQLGLDTYGE